VGALAYTARLVLSVFAAGRDAVVWIGRCRLAGEIRLAPGCAGRSVTPCG
jgi:hypothetical protein